jgi:ABC-type phosphate transport system permease subunit
VYTASLLALGLILFFITMLVLALAKWLLARTARHAAATG